LNRYHVPTFNTVATVGAGILEALKEISKLVIADLNRKGLGRRLLQEAPRGQPHFDAAAAQPGASMATAAATVPASTPVSAHAPEEAPVSPALSRASEPNVSSDISSAVNSQVQQQAPPGVATYSVLPYVWRTERQLQFSQLVEGALLQNDLPAAQAVLGNLMAECLRHGLPQEGADWDLMRCAMYKGFSAACWRTMQRILSGSDTRLAGDPRCLVMIYLLCAEAIDGVGEIAPGAPAA
jgi:hypothetical protein